MFTLKELKNKRNGVLMWGLSAEREVSLMSGKAILEALLDLGYNARSIEGDEKLPERLKKNRNTMCSPKQRPVPANAAAKIILNWGSW